jgi:predicted transcriptional regulator YdeE
MEPQLTTTKEIKLIGTEVRTTNKEEMDPTSAKIPGLWGRFFQEQVAEKIPNKKAGGVLLGVYTKYESDYTGPYSLIVGTEVNSLDAIPEGMTALTIPAGKYLVFAVEGPMPKALVDTWIQIWSYFSDTSHNQRAYSTDYEVHHGNDNADIYIAVK